MTEMLRQPSPELVTSTSAVRETAHERDPLVPFRVGESDELSVYLFTSEGHGSTIASHKMMYKAA